MNKKAGVFGLRFFYGGWFCLAPWGEDAKHWLIGYYWGKQATENTMQSAMNVKQTAHDLIDQLPVDVTWDEVVYRFVERREIELGLADSRDELVTSVAEVMREYDIKP